MAHTTHVLHLSYHHLPSTAKSSHFPLNRTKPLFPFSSFLSLSSSSPSSGDCHITRVSIAPVEYAPPPPDFDFEQEIVRLRRLRSKLSSSKTTKGKLVVIELDSRVKQIFNSRQDNFSSGLNLDSYELFFLKCLVAAGQEQMLCLGFEFVGSEFDSARSSGKSALYSLVQIIEKLDVNGNGNGGGESFGKNFGFILEGEVSDLKKLIKNLAGFENSYDCIGGIIGYQIKSFGASC